MEENIFNAKNLIDTGADILQFNHMPEKLAMSIISNMNVGFNLYLLGLARSQTEEMTLLMDTMSVLEKDIFNPENIKKLQPFEKINLYNLAKTSFKFRLDFLNDVQQKIDWSKLKADILEMVSKTGKSEGDMSPLKNNPELRNRLVSLVNESYKDQNAKDREVK